MIRHTVVLEHAARIGQRIRRIGDDEHHRVRFGGMKPRNDIL
jgi:hypothetical protein